ncbi:FkbM family methyltransferase [Bradyrhizobium cytisi]|uniref:FkbM family methyltransferase n=1 Tax=Bradyrhizobium cytisi TaxID=515489 RepID=UPI0024C0BB40|nr:FkbM family methyltransferase [Bradyrhizobium cytisi]
MDLPGSEDGESRPKPPEGATYVDILDRGLTRVIEEEVPKTSPSAGTDPVSEVHQHILSLLKKPDPIILEIGCNDGADAGHFLKLCPTAGLYCFEPDPRAVARFRKNMDVDLDKVKLFEIAISDRNGKIDFHPSNGDGDSRDWDLSGSIRHPKNHLAEYDWIRFDRPISVETRRLDTGTVKRI